MAHRPKPGRSLRRTVSTLRPAGPGVAPSSSRQTVMRDTLCRDVAYALRGLRRAPAFTLIIVLTLGAGLGAATAIFSVVNGVLLRPLPYREPERLVMIWNDFGQGAQSLPPRPPLTTSTTGVRPRCSRGSPRHGRLRSRRHGGAHGSRCVRAGGAHTDLGQPSAAARCPADPGPDVHPGGGGRRRTQGRDPRPTGSGAGGTGVTGPSSARPFSSTPSRTRSSACCRRISASSSRPRSTPSARATSTPRCRSTAPTCRRGT